MHQLDDCIFCKISRGDIPAGKIYEDDDVVAFNDIHPKAPVHFLIIPKSTFSLWPTPLPKMRHCWVK